MSATCFSRTDVCQTHDGARDMTAKAVSLVQCLHTPQSAEEWGWLTRRLGVTKGTMEAIAPIGMRYKCSKVVCHRCIFALRTRRHPYHPSL